MEEFDVLFVGGGLSTNAFFDRKRFAYEEISAATFSFSNPFQLIQRSRKIIKGIKQTKNIFQRFSPEIVVGFGSFYTLPVLIAAKFQNIPILLHEQNVIPGRVNRFFSRYAHTTAITFPDSVLRLKGRTQVVHFPLQIKQRENPWKYFNLQKGKSVLLVFGGSQGAKQLNELFFQALPFLSGYQILHFTGNHGEKVDQHYRNLNIPHVVKPFERKLHLAMQIADLAICRSGAATLAELLEAELPALLIPFPFATENHQELNAAHFIGGKCYRESQLTGQILANAIKGFPIEEKRKKIREYKQNRSLVHFSDLIRKLVS